MPYNYNYGGYPAGGYYAPPMPDNLAQLRGAQMPTMPQPMAQPTAPTPAANSGIIWVQGEEGAKAYMVAPGNTVLLMDSDGSSFYLKSADNSGMPQPLRIFDYVERTAAPKTPVAAPQAPAVEYVTRQEFQAVVDELEALKAKKCACSKKTVKEDTDVE